MPTLTQPPGFPFVVLGTARVLRRFTDDTDLDFFEDRAIRALVLVFLSFYPAHCPMKIGTPPSVGAITMLFSPFPISPNTSM